MSIQSTSRAIQDLFGTRYSIDFYQRDYKWETTQVEMLLNDVFFRFDTNYNPNVDATEECVSQYNWYYLSTYVTNQQNGRKYIVDGQQRLTTITLILIKLYHLAKAYGNKVHEQWLTQSICGAGPSGTTFWMGATERTEALNQLYTHGSPPEDPDSSKKHLTIQNIYRNYQDIDAYVGARLDTPHKAAAFTLYFMLRVELVELHIDDSRDVAMVFEVINDRGEKLQPYEVFKGELLGQLTKEEIESTYYKSWNESINPLQNWDKREPDNFFQLLFRSRYTNTRQDYRDFDGDYQRVVFSKKWDPLLKLKRNPTRVKQFLSEDVTWFAKLYRDLLKLSRDGGNGNYAFFNVRLNQMERQHLLVFSALQVNDPERDKKIRLITRLFDRHFTLLQLNDCYNSNNFTESIIALNSTIRDANCQDIQAAFDTQLLADISTAKGTTVTDPFQRAFFRNIGYGLGSRFIRYFFARTEHFIGDEAGLPVDYYNNMVRSGGKVYGYHVEHILANNAENRALFDDEEQFIRERNRLGGLVLLKGDDNRLSSNELYQKKLKTYAHAPHLTATLTEDFYHNNSGFAQLMKTRQLNFRSMPTFDGAAIEERHQLYFELARLIWGDDSFPLK